MARRSTKKTPAQYYPTPNIKTKPGGQEAALPTTHVRLPSRNNFPNQAILRWKHSESQKKAGRTQRRTFGPYIQISAVENSRGDLVRYPRTGV